MDKCQQQQQQQQPHHRRKPSHPRHLQLFLECERSADQLAEPDELEVEEEPLDLQVPREPRQRSTTITTPLLTPRLQGVLESVSELSTDLIQARQAYTGTPHDQSLKEALGHLATARYRLSDALGCLSSVETVVDASAQSQPGAPAVCSPAQQAAMQATPAVPSGDKSSDSSEKSACASPPTDARRVAPAKRRWNKDFVDESFVPWLSTDGLTVTLSKEHTAAELPLEVYQRLLEESRGAATLHLRALLKHFFPRDVLAESSVTGAGTYKRALDKEVLLSVCDYIHNRYPGAMSESRMRLCCTDVCVQARRRRTRPQQSQQQRAADNKQQVTTTAEDHEASTANETTSQSE